MELPHGYVAGGVSVGCWSQVDVDDDEKIQQFTTFIQWTQRWAIVVLAFVTTQLQLRCVLCVLLLLLSLRLCCKILRCK